MDHPGADYLLTSPPSCPILLVEVLMDYIADALILALILVAKHYKWLED